MISYRFMRRFSKYYPDVVHEIAAPKWYELTRKQFIRWMDKNNIKYEITERV